MRNTKFQFFFSAILLVLFFPILTQAGMDTGILRATLTNGLKVVIVRNTLAPVVTTQVNYLVRSNEAPPWVPRYGSCAGTYDVQRESGVVRSPALRTLQLSSVETSMQVPRRLSPSIFSPCRRRS